MSAPDTGRKLLDPEDQLQFSVDELSRSASCSVEWIVTLVHEGVIEPLGAAPAEWRFEGLALQRTRRAARLARDLEINVPGVALVLELLERIERLEAGLAARGLG